MVPSKTTLWHLGHGKDTMTDHGFRTMARTILDEVLHVRPDYIERQLGHAVRDSNGHIYNRTNPYRSDAPQCRSGQITLIS